MLEILRKSWAFVFLLLIFVLLAALVFWPALARPLGAAVLVLSIVVTVLLTIQRHWRHRQAGGGKQFIRNPAGRACRDLALDLLGLGLTIGAAMYAGQLAGAYVGLRAELWAGPVAGFAAGLLAAWGVRFAWERLTARV